MYKTTGVKRFDTSGVITICSCDRVCNTLFQQSINCPHLPETMHVTSLTPSECTNRVGNSLNKNYNVYLDTKDENKTVCLFGAGKKKFTKRKTQYWWRCILFVQALLPNPLRIQTETKLKTLAGETTAAAAPANLLLRTYPAARLGRAQAARGKERDP